ncbi:phosphatidylinositol 3 and 4-kinase-domain-containing protein [Syncephalis fuscata]|nr:phosphatidylinositol 3 and 4-kinase-domain-containing protein [Syncephalis fuscata]
MQRYSSRRHQYQYSSTPPRKTKSLHARRRHWLPLFIAPPRPRLVISTASPPIDYSKHSWSLSSPHSSSDSSSFPSPSAQQPTTAMPWLNSHRPINILLDTPPAIDSPYLASNSSQPSILLSSNRHSRQEKEEAAEEEEEEESDNEDNEEINVRRPLLGKLSHQPKRHQNDGNNYAVSEDLVTKPLVKLYRRGNNEMKASYAVIYSPLYTPINTSTSIAIPSIKSSMDGRHKGSSARIGMSASPRSSVPAVPATDEEGTLRRSTRRKRKGRKRQVDLRMSVFQPLPNELESWQTEVVSCTPFHAPVNSRDFNSKVDRVKMAINNNIQPERNAQGSSGSYFCRMLLPNSDEVSTRYRYALDHRDPPLQRTQVVGIFKPKNEEPYGHLNPKWTKWLHRNCFPCFFGRSCLIPNLGYLSESAAFLLDQRLGLNIVPHTNIAHLASTSFYYGKRRRRRANREHNEEGMTSTGNDYLPQKIGSFQLFVDGYEDADKFFSNHPWTEDDAPEVDPAVDYTKKNATAEFRWSASIKKQFQEEFEKLVILDYLMRNTDRGMDNWMIKWCMAPDEHPAGWCTTSEEDCSQLHTTATTTAAAATNHYNVQSDIIFNDHSSDHTSKQATRSLRNTNSDLITPEYLSGPSTASPSNSTRPHLHIAAIDNGLAFPWKHPDEWRSYPFGWLSLPSSIIERPFSEFTRQAMLTKLTNHRWWERTVQSLHALFRQDEDFNERMFHRQLSVIKGQAWNLVECLRDPTKGPVHLCDMVAVAVIEEEVDAPSPLPVDPNHPPAIPLTEQQLDGDGEEGGESPPRPPHSLARLKESRYRRSVHSLRSATSNRSQHSRRSNRSGHAAATATATGTYHGALPPNYFDAPAATTRTRRRQRVKERLQFLTQIRPCFTWC